MCLFVCQAYVSVCLSLSLLISINTSLSLSACVLCVPSVCLCTTLLICTAVRSNKSIVNIMTPSRTTVPYVTYKHTPTHRHMKKHMQRQTYKHTFENTPQSHVLRAGFFRQVLSDAGLSRGQRTRTGVDGSSLYEMAFECYPRHNPS